MKWTITIQGVDLEDTIPADLEPGDSFKAWARFAIYNLFHDAAFHALVKKCDAISSSTMDPFAKAERVRIYEQEFRIRTHMADNFKIARSDT